MNNNNNFILKLFFIIIKVIKANKQEKISKK